MARNKVEISEWNIQTPVLTNEQMRNCFGHTRPGSIGQGKIGERQLRLVSA